MKLKLSMKKGYWDDSPKFMGDHFTAVITKNVIFAAHPVEDRFFNIRELLHLMGMPNDFQVENPTRNWNHICQNVPVNTAADWASEVVKFCRGQLEITPFVFMKQDNCKQSIVEKEVGKKRKKNSEKGECPLCKQTLNMKRLLYHAPRCYGPMETRGASKRRRGT